MSVENAIHQRWTADAALVALVPAERLFTGLALGSPALPYVVLERRSDTAATHTSSGASIARGVARFNIYSARRAEANQIASAIRARFHRSDFVVDGVRVLNMQHAAREEERIADGACRVSIDYSLLWIA